jgi:hypothetical protein
MQLDNKSLEKEIEQQVLSMSLKGVKVAKDKIPLDTGRLRDTVRTADIVTKGSVTSGGVLYGGLVVDGEAVDYAPYLEFGTYKSQKHVGFISRDFRNRLENELT